MTDEELMYCSDRVGRQKNFPTVSGIDNTFSACQ
jgi:hypothetical protein